MTHVLKQHTTRLEAPKPLMRTNIQLLLMTSSCTCQMALNTNALALASNETHGRTSWNKLWAAL